MWNPCENPILLSGIALIVLAFLVLFTDVKSWQKALIPLAIIGLAFGIDLIIKTDKEQITAIIENCKTAAVNRTPAVIAEYLSNDYRDSFHSSKASIVMHCNSMLSQPLVSKVNIPFTEMVIEEDSAKVTIDAVVFLDKNSPYSSVEERLPMKVELNFKKNSDEWLISRVEILEIMKKDFSWRMAI